MNAEQMMKKRQEYITEGMWNYRKIVNEETKAYYYNFAEAVSIGDIAYLEHFKEELFKTISPTEMLTDLLTSNEDLIALAFDNGAKIEEYIELARDSCDEISESSMKLCKFLTHRQQIELVTKHIYNRGEPFDFDYMITSMTALPVQLHAKKYVYLHRWHCLGELIETHRIPRDDDFDVVCMQIVNKWNDEHPFFKLEYMHYTF